MFSHFSGKNLSLIVEQFILQDADGGGESSPQLWCYSGVSTMVLLWWVPCPTLVLLWCVTVSTVVKCGTTVVGPLPSAILVLLWCSTVATYGTSLDSGVLLCTCGESPVQVYCNSCVYCGSVVLLWCVNCGQLCYSSVPLRYYCEVYCGATLVCQLWCFH